MLPNDALVLASNASELRPGDWRARCLTMPCQWSVAPPNDATVVSRNAGQGRSRVALWRWPRVLPNCALAMARNNSELRFGCGKRLSQIAPLPCQE